jgi:phosphopantothenoylcysteine synthetase/decarboxylase
MLKSENKGYQGKEGDVNELLVTLKWAQSLSKQFKRCSNRRTRSTLKKVTKETLKSVKKFCYDFDTFLNKSEDEMSEKDEDKEDEDVEEEEEEEEETETEEEDDEDVEDDDEEKEEEEVGHLCKNSVICTTTRTFPSLSAPGMNYIVI